MLNDGNNLLSIYILCHNRANDAKHAIASVLGQTDTKFNLVVSDNSSDDAVEHMVKKNYPNITYVRRNPMLPSALHFKCVIDEAKSDYLCLFHDDDLMHADFVRGIKEAIQKYPEAAAIGCNAQIENYGKLSAKLSFQSYRDFDLIKTAHELASRYFSRFQSGIAPFPGYVYNTKIVTSDVMDIEGGKYSDVTMLLNISQLGEVVWVSKPLMTYRIHGSNDGSVESLRDRLRFLRYLQKNRKVIGEGVLEDYRCSFIYKPISKLESSLHQNRKQRATAYLNRYRWHRFIRLDTYLSIMRRALVKAKSRL